MPQFKSIIASVFSLLYGPALASIHDYQKNHSFSLRPHGLQHTRPPCPSPTPRVYSDSFCIESVMPSNHLNLCCPLLLPLQSFPVSRYFQMSQFFASGGQSISISPSNAYSGLISFRMDWLDNLTN